MVVKTYRDQRQTAILLSSAARQSRIAGSSQGMHSVDSRPQGRKAKNKDLLTGGNHRIPGETRVKGRTKTRNEAVDAIINPDLSIRSSPDKRDKCVNEVIFYQKT